MKLFALCGGLGLLQEAAAGVVDHYLFAAVASAQRAGVPLAVTVSALDSNGLPVTSFSGPVQLFFTNNATPLYFNDFSGGFPFDTDGDGTTDGAEWRMISGDGLNFYGTYGFSLHSNTVYSLSFDQALSPGGTSQLLFSPDAVLYSGLSPAQIGSWGGWFPPGQVSRYSPCIEFASMGEGAHMLMLRYWLPLGGSTSIYTDNIKVRVRDVSPSLVSFQGGQWTGDLTLFCPGTNLVLRALDNNGRSGDSNPFDVLPRAADASVAMLPHDFLPVGQWAWINFLVSNAGPSSIEGVILTNEIPPDLTLIQTVPYGGAMVDSTHVVTALPAIAGGNSLAFSLVVQRFQAGVAPVTASLSAPDYDSNPSNHMISGSVIFVPVLTGADVTVTEAKGGTNATLQFGLNATNAQDVAVNYMVSPISATPGSDYTQPPPGTIVFPAGTTQQSLVVPVLDDVFYEADEQFSVTLSITTGTPAILARTSFTVTIVSDDSLPILTVALPNQALESVGTLTNAGSFTVSAPFEQDLWLTVASDNPARLRSPGILLLPAGQTNGTYDLPVVDDPTWNLPQTVTITVSCTNGMSGSATMTVLNDDPPALALTASFKPIEGNGTVTNGLRVSVPFAPATNVTITLTSSDTTEMVVPGSVTLPAGATFAYISPTVVDDTESDGPQNVIITAAAAGFVTGTLNLTVADNDLHHFTFGGEQGLPSLRNQTSAVPFRVSISAQDIASNTLTGFTQAVVLSATSDLGTVLLSPTITAAFVRGSWSGSVTISNGDFTNVRLVATETNGGGHSGQSNPFRVYAAPAQQLRITKAQIVGQDLRLQFNSVSGRNYRLESSSEPAGAAWNLVVPAITGLGGSMTITNFGGFGAPRQFYRMALQP